MVIAADWMLSNLFFYLYGNAAVRIIAPMNVVVLGIFWALWRAEGLNGRFIHKIFFSYYCIYVLVNVWQILGRIFFPKTLAATDYFTLATSNGVFVLLVATLWLFGVLKFIDIRAEGGLLGVYERNISKWRGWFGKH